MRCECPKIIHTRQRKAPLRGAGCADAHTASAEVGSVVSASALGEIRRFGGLFGGKSNAAKRVNQTFVAPINNPVEVG